MSRKTAYVSVLGAFMLACGGSDQSEKQHPSGQDFESNTKINQVITPSPSSLITVTTPSGLKKSFDCSCLHVEDGKLWMTGEAVEAIDALYSGQSVKKTGLTYKKDLSSNKVTRGNQLSNNLYLLMSHASRQHFDCVAQTARYEDYVAKANGRDIDLDGIFGEGWENKTDCMTKEVSSQCERALGIK